MDAAEEPVAAVARKLLFRPVVIQASGQLAP
jgi:hypothetical protein